MSAAAESAASKLPPWLLAGLTAALRAAPEAIADIHGNVGPPAPDMTASLANGIDAVAAFLPMIVTALRTHPGEITGAAHILDAAANAGVPYAADVRQWVLETPGAADAAESWVGRIQWMLATFAPAPNASGGMGPDRDLHGRG